MINQEWQDLHNDNFDSDDYTGKDVIDVEIEWGTNITYECKVEVETFNNLPVGDAEVVAMTRYVFDANSGHEFEGLRTELDIHEFPHFISKAAEKKARGL